MAILAKISGGCTLERLGGGWGASLSRGFDRTIDADLLREGKSGAGWPVLEGRHIHQFNCAFAKPEFAAPVRLGLQREARKKVYRNESRKFFHSFRLGFRDISSPTNFRTFIASIIPPQRFFTCSLRAVVLDHHGYQKYDNDYDRKIAYLCGILNSMTFDFAVRGTSRMNMAIVVNSAPFPTSLVHQDEIIQIATRLSVGTGEFEGFAESLRVENTPLAPPERIRATARLDALVAHAYGLTRDEYETVLESFKFGENPGLLEARSADFNDNQTLRQFYGEVRKIASSYYDEIAGGVP